MPWAWWAKFDTSESIKNWLNVINKSVEAHCSPCNKKATKLSPSKPLTTTQDKRQGWNLWHFFSFFVWTASSEYLLNPVKIISVAEASTFILARAMCFHIHMRHPSVYSWVCFHPEKEINTHIFPREVGRVIKKLNFSCKFITSTHWLIVADCLHHLRAASIQILRAVPY